MTGRGRGGGAALIPGTATASIWARGSGLRSRSTDWAGRPQIGESTVDDGWLRDWGMRCGGPCDRYRGGAGTRARTIFTSAGRAGDSRRRRKDAAPRDWDRLRSTPPLCAGFTLPRPRGFREFHVPSLVGFRIALAIALPGACGIFCVLVAVG